MKLDFLSEVPYVCERWAEVVVKDPAAVFLTEELSGNSYSREQVDDQSARVYAWLKQKEVGAEDFVLISLPRDARPFIAMLGVWKAGAAFTVGATADAVRSSTKPYGKRSARRIPCRALGGQTNMTPALRSIRPAVRESPKAYCRNTERSN